MSKIVPSVGMLVVLAVLCNAAFADTAADLSEDMTAAGAPARQRAAAPGLHGFIGAGVFDHEKIVGSGGREIHPLPMVITSYDSRIYMSLASVGVWLIRSDDRTARFGAGVKARLGWDPGDDPLLAGMSSRANSADGYFNVLFRTPVATISSAVYRDLGRESNGSAATLRLSHNFWFDGTFRLTPSIGVEWLSDKLTDYYYGVRPSEARPGRPVYEGRETVNVSAGLTGFVRVSRAWSFLGGAYVTNLGSGIRDSPVVTRSATTLGFFGAGVVF